MSHVVSMRVRVTDLEALKLGAAECGLEFREGQTTYRWFGRYVGDYAGGDAAERHAVRPADYGKNAAHALRVAGNTSAYEVGVVAAEDGYQLVWDNWAGGYGLSKLIGTQGERLQQAYAKHAALRALQANGHAVLDQTQLADGRYRIRALVM